MIKQLLVGLDGSDATEAVVRYGCGLAARHGARLIGLAAVNTADIETAYHTPRPMGAGSIDQEHYKKARAEAAARARTAVEVFNKVCQECGAGHEAVEVEGDPAGLILKKADLNDLVILARQTRFSYGLSDEDFRDATPDVLEKCARPLLLVTGPFKEVKRVMIAVDFQRLSAQLIHTYVHLNPWPDAEVHLVHASVDEKAEFPPELIEYLKVHDIQAKTRVLHGDHPGQALVNYAETEEIDMAVIGIHTVSQVWSVILGKTGRYVLDHIKIPVFTST